MSIVQKPLAEQTSVLFYLARFTERNGVAQLDKAPAVVSSRIDVLGRIFHTDLALMSPSASMNLS